MKTKAGTIYVNNELAEKANISSLSDYVDNLLPKSYIYLGFKENGGLTQNSFQWNFVNGVNGAKVVIPRPGKIVSGTLWAVSGNDSVSEIRVQFEINDTLRSETTITKRDGEESFVVDYPVPIQVQRNDRIRVSSQTSNNSVSASTVCILIELDQSLKRRDEPLVCFIHSNPP